MSAEGNVTQFHQQIKSISKHNFRSITQLVVRLKNGRGVSIIRGPGTYGSSEGLFELAFLDSADEITENPFDPEGGTVIGWLDGPAVEHEIRMLAALPPEEVESDAGQPE
jgi:hypothetical protein